MEAAISELPDIQCSIRWRPFFLAGQSMLRNYPDGKLKDEKDPTKRTSMRLLEAGMKAGINFTGKTDRYPNTTLAHTLMSYTLEKDGAEIQSKLAEIVFRHYFTDGKYPNHQHLLEAAMEAGVSDPTAALAYAAVESNQKPILDEARSYSSGGVSGVPFFFINEKPSGSGAMSSSSFKELLEKEL